MTRFGSASRRRVLAHWFQHERMPPMQPHAASCSLVSLAFGSLYISRRMRLRTASVKPCRDAQLLAQKDSKKQR